MQDYKINITLLVFLIHHKCMNYIIHNKVNIYYKLSIHFFRNKRYTKIINLLNNKKNFNFFLVILIVNKIYFINQIKIKI
jgi:hypothetical protein